MNLTVDIKDKATETLSRLRGGVIDAEALHRNMGRGVQAAVKSHLVAKGYVGRVNALGGKSTGFWKRVHDSLSLESSTESAVIGFNQRGFALRLKGGTVSKKTGGPNLSIPVDPSAHGVSASLYPRDLLYGQPKKGASPDTVGYLFLRGQQKRKKDGSPAKGYERGDLIYVLRKKTTHPPDPGALPTEADLLKAATNAAGDYLDSLGDN